MKRGPGTGVNPDGTERTWSAHGTRVTASRAFIDVANGFLDVGGETYLPVSMDCGGMPCAGDVLTVESFDPDVLKPLTDTVTLDADGQGELLVEGTGVGQTSLVLRNSIGDQGSTTQGATPPLITSTGHVTQGATYNSSNMPGFTFTAPYPSVSPVVVNYTTAGSTVPTSLRSPFGVTGSETLPAGNNPTLFVPYTPPDDGKIAPDRELVLTPVMVGVPAYPFGPTTRMVVTNTDGPSITINGAIDNAVIELDPQGDNNLLTDIHMATNQYDQNLISTTLTWLSSDFTIWLNKKIGAPGTDLGSLPAAVHNPYTGGVSYTWNGAPPLDVYGQCMNGSSDWDNTIVYLSSKVVVAATPVAPASTRDAASKAKGTARGVVITGTGVTPGGSPPQIVIGQRINLSGQWEGPGAPNDTDTVTWSIQGSIALGFISVAGLDSPTSGMGGPLAFENYADPYKQNGNLNQISFIWWKAPPNGEIDKITCSLDGTAASQDFNVASPEAVVKTTPTPHSGAIVSGYFSSGDAAGNVSITFAAYAKEPQNRSGGSYRWVQVINIDIERSDSLFGIIPLGHSSTVFNNALDGSWPYTTFGIVADKWILGKGGYGDALSLQTTTADLPEAQLGAWTTTERFSATMTLMYEPAGGGAIDWVPLQSVPWTWSGEETNGNVIYSKLQVSPSVPSKYPSWKSIKPRAF